NEVDTTIQNTHTDGRGTEQELATLRGFNHRRWPAGHAKKRTLRRKDFRGSTGQLWRVIIFHTMRKKRPRASWNWTGLRIAGCGAGESPGLGEADQTGDGVGR